MYKNGNKGAVDFTANPSKYPQKRFNPKPCKHCGTVFEPLAPSHLYCSDACRDKVYSNRYLKKNYNMNVDELQKMGELQNDKCGICQETGFKMRESHKTYLVVDHDHATGAVRGLLCHNCNRGLGLFQDSKDNLLRAIQYLEGATTIP
jgi:predicted nucleic acid-binding Zn ribbon protein